MNIAIFTNNYLPNPYGVSTSVEGFRRELMHAGHTVYIFAPEWGKNNKEEKNIYRYPSVKMPTKIELFMVVPHSHKINEILNDLEIDVIHAQHPNLLGSMASKWALKKNVPLVFTWHSLYDRYAHYMPLVPDNLSGKWAMRSAGAFADECDHVIVPTESVIDIIRDAGVEHDRISVVASGVDEELFESSDGSKIKEKYNIGDDKKVLVTISRLTEEKNVLFLARSIAQVLKQSENTIFLCGGEGDLQGNMKEIFKDSKVLEQVIFTGKIEREDVKNYLDASDVFVYASTSETQGTIVTENMYVGKPIVAVGKNGVGDLIENNVNGIAIEEDEELFAQAVIDLLNDEQKIKELSENAYKIAREKYTTKACTQKLVDVYEKVIDLGCRN
ncbi:MAG: glycosyltransferase [Patescibacteria group bacterium]